MIDDGGYEEVWGVPTWVPAPLLVSTCCLSEVEEVEDELGED